MLIAARYLARDVGTLGGWLRVGVVRGAAVGGWPPTMDGIPVEAALDAVESVLAPCGPAR